MTNLPAYQTSPAPTVRSTSGAHPAPSASETAHLAPVVDQDDWDDVVLAEAHGEFVMDANGLSI
jgi:hypothetical protein